MARIIVGTSGWHYASWREKFFPERLLAKHQLRFYVSQFATAELNGVFYRTPTEQAVRSWKAETGKDFVFAWKASKFITHWKRLSAKCENSIALLESRYRLLGPKGGPVLFQLPPNFREDLDRLRAFVKMLPSEWQVSFEFRHPSWYSKPVFEFLTAHNIALCISDHHDAPAPWKKTADFVYVRGHGPGGRYKGHYSEEALAAWARRIKSWHREGCNVYVYFDNDQKSAAPADALQLKSLLGQLPKAAPRMHRQKKAAWAGSSMAGRGSAN
jgi:uncharacterized protein YecE (DUF72 family)